MRDSTETGLAHMPRMNACACAHMCVAATDEATGLLSFRLRSISEISSGVWAETLAH